MKPHILERVSDPHIHKEFRDRKDKRGIHGIQSLGYGKTP